jgi:uncharacterized small protein (TIGR04563 family)
MRRTKKRKQSVHFSGTTVKEIASEANRLDRSLSWVVQEAWKLAKKQIAQLPLASRNGGQARDVRQPGENDRE